METASLIQAANTAFQQKRYSDAAELCKSILETDSEIFLANLLLGAAFTQLSKPCDAVLYLRKARELDSNSADALKFLAQALRAKGEVDEAFRLASSGVKLHSLDADLRALLAEIFIARKEPLQAANHLKVALEIRPKSVPFHLLMGKALELLNDDRSAFEVYRLALGLNPRSAKAHASIAKLLLANGDAESAAKGFRAAIECGEVTSEIHICMAQALIALDQEEEATEHLRAAISIDPNTADAHAMLAYRDQTKGNFDAARIHFLRSTEIQPEQAVSYYGLVQSKRITTEDEQLVLRMQSALVSDSLSGTDRMILQFSLGKALTDLGDYEAAMHSYDEGNRLAFQVRLGGKPFPRERYSDILRQTANTYTQEFFDLNRAHGSASNQPIFIVGMMRSGTTLVDQILSSHAEVGAMGERDFWLQQPSIDWDPATAATIQDSFLNLQRQAVPDRPFITDKTPQNYQVLGLIHAMFPLAKIIHVTRTPIDNAFSIYTTAYDRSPDFAHDQGNIAFAYRAYEEIMNHWRTVIPGKNMIEISYENLIANHDEVVRDLIDACHLNWDTSCLRHETNKNIVKTPSLWQVRQPIYGSSVGKWRHFEPWLGELLKLK